MVATALKTPFPLPDGLDNRAQAQIYRDFQEIEKFLGPLGVPTATGGILRDPKTGTYTFNSGVTFAGAETFSGATTFTGVATFQNSLILGTGGVFETAAASPNMVITNASPNVITFNTGATRNATITAANIGSGNTDLILETTNQGSSTVVGLRINDNTGTSNIQFEGGRFDFNSDIFGAGKIMGGGAASQFETVALAGSNCGISMIARGGTARYVFYPDNNYMYLWNQHEYIHFYNANGDTNSSGRLQLGKWPASATYAAIGNRGSFDRSTSNYTLLLNDADHDIYMATNNVDGNGAFQWRLANNGATIMSLGVNNRGQSAAQSFDLSIPALSGGNTMNYQFGSSGQVGFISSMREHKHNIRTLKETPEPDSGHDNPIFRLRPVRFNWKQDTRHPNGGWNCEGVANADEVNARFPNGVVGLIAEEVHEHAPDACLWAQHKDPEPWDRAKHGMPYNDHEGNEVTEVPGWEERITGLDHDRLMAYVIDAVQHLKEEIEAMKGRAA